MKWGSIIHDVNPKWQVSLLIQCVPPCIRICLGSIADLDLDIDNLSPNAILYMVFCILYFVFWTYRSYNESGFLPFSLVKIKWLSRLGKVEGSSDLHMTSHPPTIHRATQLSVITHHLSWIHKTSTLYTTKLPENNRG